MRQRAEDCAEHENCTVGIGLEGDRELWRSHMTADIPVEVRLNPDHPEIEDHRGGRGGRKLRWREADDEEARKMGWTEEDRQRVRSHARARKLLD
jgi:hypothetical protein